MTRPAGHILGLDPGERRIGVAISDELGMIARPLTVIARRSWSEDLARLGRLIAEHDIARVVVGWPVSLSGDPGSAARRSERFAARVAEATGRPVELYDERLTTVEAREILRGMSRRRAVPIDAAAAAVLLQRYLDDRRCA